MVGPDAFAPSRTIRTPTDPGPPVVAKELVTLSPSAPMSIQLPDPRLTPGKPIAFTTDANNQDITFLAYPGTTIHGGASWAWTTGLPYGGMIFYSIGSEWRAVARFPGV